MTLSCSKHAYEELVERQDFETFIEDCESISGTLRNWPAFDEFTESSALAEKVYKEIHNPEKLYADTFILFERIMNLGIKELYYLQDSELAALANNPLFERSQTVNVSTSSG